MPSLRRHEGYLLIDHRNSPGVPDDLIRASGKDAPIVRAGEHYEAATMTCSHCHVQMIRNPLRTRERGYCGKCDHFVCDRCEAVRVTTGECALFVKTLDRAQEHAAKYLGREDDPASTPRVLLA